MNEKPIIPVNTKFLVSTQVRYELDSASEIWHCLYATGSDVDHIDVHFIRKRNRSIGGLIAIVFDGDPILAIRKIRQYLYEHPWIIYYTSRIIPVEYVTTDKSALIKKAVDLALKRLSSDALWRISISRHASKISKLPLIDAIASKIDIGKVSLDSPEWIINIEIIKNTFLVSVLKPSDIIRKKEFSEILNKNKVLEYIQKR